MDQERRAADVAVLATQVQALTEMVRRETELADERAKETDRKIDRIDQKMERLAFIDPQTYAADKFASAEQRKNDLSVYERRFEALERFKDKVLYGAAGVVALALVSGGYVVTQK